MKGWLVMSGKSRLFSVALATLLACGTLSAHSAAQQGRLTDANLSVNAMYNGIVIPEDHKFLIDPNNGFPQTIPYLVDANEGGYAPNLINIDRGRQLFVDDFLIEQTNLERVFYSALQNDEPVFAPETSFEISGRPSTAATSGGIWYDMEEKIYKMWYEAAFNNRLAYATSTDGIHWERPAINTNGSNLLVQQQQTDSFSVWIDYEAPATERYKLMIRSPNGGGAVNTAQLYESADGIHFKNIGESGICGDRSTFFYNPFTKEYVFSIRTARTAKWGYLSYKPRMRLFHSASTFLAAGQWEKNEPISWIKPDAEDKIDYSISNEIPQLYNFDSIAYESLMLGFNQMWYGPENDVISKTKNPKITELQVSFSRDGFYYDRPNRNAFISASRTEGTWDYGYLQSATGGVIVYDDFIRIYYSGFSGDFAKDALVWEGAYVGGSVGYATLRRDGFASMNGTGSLLTKPLTVTKEVKYLFVNTSTTEGSLKAEILDKNGNVLEGFSAEDCVAITDNTCKTMVSWQNGKDLSMLRGKEFRIRFLMENGELYSFWLAPDEHGASNGELAAGYVSEEESAETAPPVQTPNETEAIPSEDTTTAASDTTSSKSGCRSSLSTAIPVVLSATTVACGSIIRKKKKDNQGKE